MDYVGIIKKTGDTYTMKTYTNEGKKVVTASNIDDLFKQL